MQTPTPLRHSTHLPTTEVLGRREALIIWTAPANGRCGQLCVLYETREGGRAAWVAIGRLCSDAVEGLDSRTRAWVQWRQVKQPVPHEKAKLKLGVGSVQGSYGALNEGTFQKLAELMCRGDRVSLETLERWEAGRAFPASDRVPFHQLSERPKRGHERDLYPDIEAELEERGWRELPPNLEELVKRLRGSTATDPERDQRLMPDVRVCKPRAKRLLVVEVKRDAVPKEGDYDPVRQVVNYVKWIRRELRRSHMPGWTVEPMLVAEWFHDDVRRDAARARVPGGARGIPCAEFAENRLRSLRPLRP